MGNYISELCIAFSVGAIVSLILKPTFDMTHAFVILCLILFAIYFKHD